MWNAYIFTTSEPPQSLTAMDVANMMVLLKVSRSKTSLDRSEFHRDSHVDMAGYAGLGGRAWDEIQESVQPRQWQSFEEVPDGVVVRGSNSTSMWKYENGRRYLKTGLEEHWDHGERMGKVLDFVRGPFTEVLDG